MPTLRIERYDALEWFDLLDDDRVKVLGDIIEQRLGGVVTMTMRLRLRVPARLQPVGYEHHPAQEAQSELEEILEKAVAFGRDGTLTRSYWIRMGTNYEIGGDRRALIVKYGLVPVPSVNHRALLQDGMTLWDLTITRRTEWEDINPTTVSTTGLGAQGGVWDLTATKGGRYDARIAELRLEPTGVGMIYDSYWIGIKPNPEGGGLSTFDPVIDWGTEYGSPLGDDTTDLGTELQVTFSTTATMAIRAYAPMSAWGGGSLDWKDFKGRYRVLLRFKYSDTSTSCGIQMRTKGSASDHEQQYETQYPSAGAPHDVYQLIPLGEMTFGPQQTDADYETDMDWQQFRLQIYAERNEGSGNLVFSHCILIPLDHMTATTQELSIGLEPTEYAYIRTHATGQSAMDVAVQSNGRRVSSPEPEYRNWVYPRHGGKLVFAGHQYTFAHAAADTADIQLTLHKRWRTYRDQ